MRSLLWTLKRSKKISCRLRPSLSQTDPIGQVEVSLAGPGPIQLDGYQVQAYCQQKLTKKLLQQNLSAIRPHRFLVAALFPD